MKVVGITGTIGSGKDVAKSFFEKKFSCYSSNLSDLIRTELLEKKKIKVDKNLKQNLGNDLRKQYGNHVLAELAWNFLQKNRELIVIGGIRNPGEIEFLKKKAGKDFVLIAVDAPRELRWEKVQKRNKSTDPKTYEEFVAIDEKDLGTGEPEYGQQVRKCMSMADYKIENNGSDEEFFKKLDEIAKEIKS